MARHYHPVVVFYDSDVEWKEMIHKAFCATRAHAQAACFRYMDSVHRTFVENLRPHMEYLSVECGCADAPHQWWRTPEAEDGSWIEFGAIECDEREC